jgi:uncharacterized protein YkuJ
MTIIEKLKAAAEKATQGKWDYYLETGMEGHGIVVTYTEDENGYRSIKTVVYPRRDASEFDKMFFAEANPATIQALLREREVYRAALENLIHDKWARTGTSSEQLCKNLEGNMGSYTVGEFCEEALAAGDALISELERGDEHEEK